MSYLRFVPSVPSTSGLTKSWSVSSNDQSNYLGTIRWYAQWRRYCFFPKSDTVFDQGCLGELANFCRKETQAHKAGV